MRKRLQLLFILLVSLFYKGQDNSIAASVNTPISYQTGVPDISYPLVSLPAAKDMTLNFGLTYNPNSYKLGEYCGQVARNWSLSGSNFTIIRIVSDSPDEILPATSKWDDLYYYSLNGEQGSFKFEKIGNYPNESYKIIKLTPTNIKIDFEKATSDTWPRYLISFTITDSKGYKYFFKDFDSGIYRMDNGVLIQQRNIFYVTKIVDALNNDVAIFHNKKYIMDEQNRFFKFLPEEILTRYGQINFEHENAGEDFAFQDRFYFKNVTLKNLKNEIVSKYDFQIETSIYDYYYWNEYIGYTTQLVKTRKLSRLNKLNKNSDIAESTNFEYSQRYPRKYGPSQNYWGAIFYNAYTSEDPNSLMFDLLKAVQLPSGGRIEYEFEPNKMRSQNEINEDIDKNTPSYIDKIKDPSKFTDPEIEYVEMVKEIAFDSKISKIYNITGLSHSPNSRIYIRFQKEEVYPWEDDPTIPNLTGGLPVEPKLAFKVKNALSTNNANEIENQCDKCYYVVPSNGTAKLEITGSGGKGYFFIFEKFYTNPPYINETTLPNSGVRIRTIKFYDKGQNFIPNNPNPTYNLRKTISFDYNKFDNSGISSGFWDDSSEKKAVIYKNVKVIESDKQGYTKYYYKKGDDFPKYPLPNNPNDFFNPSENYTKTGVLHKKEIYDINNEKKNSIELDYIFPANIASIDWDNTIIPDNITTTSTSYDSSGNSMTETMEKTFNQSNNNLMSEKRTSADGTVSETVYQYAAEKNNTKLLGANMFSVPLEVTQKQDGVQTGKLETRYDQSGNYFPSSVQSFGINNVITGEQTNDIYDTMGNVLQTTNKAGVPTAIIWGYDRTQPIAKIEGLGYNTMLALMGQSDASGLEIVQKSNQDISSTDNTNEQLLRDALETFRKKPEFKNYLITTYTYDPLIGVKSVTSPNGFTEYYFYDNQNRLIRVEDANHNVIRENKYQQNVYTN